MSESGDEPSYDDLVSSADVDSLRDNEALKKIGLLVDLAGDRRDKDGLTLALRWCAALNARSLSPGNGVLLEYYQANIWANLRNAQRQDRASVWAWEQSELQQQIFHLRRAEHHSGFSSSHPLRKCQILTNLANQLSTVGRFADAQAYWRAALEVNPRFGMALGNRSYGLYNYAQALYDPGHARLMLRVAYDGVASAIDSRAQYGSPNYEDAKRFFSNLRDHIRSIVDLDEAAAIDLDGHSLGDSGEERDYRRWCLQRCLFLNPLNDAVERPIAGQDILLLPNMVAPLDKPPALHGFFNQMKQEFISARWLYYEGIESIDVHFADRKVALYNTLDYPSYSVAVEKVKAAYRIAYSVFDKIAYFLNVYMNLQIRADRVSFRGAWYENSDRNRPVRHELNNSENWPLRGLFWLAKDLFDEHFQDLTEPDGRALFIIRNWLEHRYLKVHEILPTTEASSEIWDHMWRDDLAYSVQRQDFEAKTLRVLKLVRSALIYLALAVHQEERRRSKEQGDSRVVPISLGLWADEFKR